MEVVTAGPIDHHPTAIAGLQGARLVTASETEIGRRWAEPRIKALTGGDRIPARFMRQDFFEFLPKFKLFITGNHRPAFSGINEAIRRRLHLIPFAVTIDKRHRDLSLSDKLRTEWEGILQWCLDGCKEWLSMGGLNPPETVLRATEDYLSDEDTLGVFIRESCALGRRMSCTAQELFQEYRKWCDQNNEDPGSQKRFTLDLISRNGISRVRFGKDRTRGFKGVALRADTTDT